MAVFLIHVEPGERDVVWWAETPEVSGLSVAADTLSELRSLIEEAAARHLAPGSEVELLLAMDGETNANPASHPGSELPLPDIGVGIVARVTPQIRSWAA